ncbi:hypothetical protein IEQ34_009862 [Dendrobium chrysotoxum]|uniref:Uncharacterized protein n=1 Tax=Dendrobium chrysotoxum TaxID=161865 RepID=A0AAV7H361_DENCH|nr:hypothetical protein IEQ34_009862 [Dendrobium chrysotoxum]
MVESNTGIPAEKEVHNQNYDDSHNVDIGKPKACDDDIENVPSEKSTRELENTNAGNIEPDKLEDIIEDNDGRALINFAGPLLGEATQEGNNHSTSSILNTNTMEVVYVDEGGLT